MTTINQDRAAKLIRMLASDNDGEVLNAARMLKKIGIHEIAALVEGGMVVNQVAMQSAPADPFSFVMRGFEFNWENKPKPQRRRNPRTSADAVRYRIETDTIVKLFAQHAREPVETDRKSIIKFLKKLGYDVVAKAVEIACQRVDAGDAFRYFCGICWARIREIEEGAE